tara:strand:+ start:5190 stop:5702 length:513 start_codon:yes stop_codon:yes gene_type:complete
MEDALLNFSQQMGIYSIMNTRWGWPIIESLHFFGLCLLIGTVGLFDLRMLGFVRSIPLAAMHKLVPVGVFGYLLNVITGTMFFTSVPDQYLYNPAFQTKMLFMLGAGINVMFFYSLCYREVKGTAAGQQLSSRTRVLAGISLLCWMGVITAGRLITFYRPPTYIWCFWCS